MVRSIMALLAASMLVFAGCEVRINSRPSVSGSGTPKTEERPLGEFNSVKLAVGMNLKVTCDQEPAIRITSDDNIVPLVKTEVKDGVLEIWSDDDLIVKSESVIELSAKAISGLGIEGAGDIEVTGMKCETGSLAISGAGSIKGDVEAADLKIKIAGSGDVVLKGKATKLSLAIGGSGNAELEELIGDDVSVSIAGSGDAALHADKKIAVSIAGSGDVTWTGNASEVESSVAGSGAVTKK